MLSKLLTVEYQVGDSYQVLTAHGKNVRIHDKLVLAILLTLLTIRDVVRDHVTDQSE